MSPPAATNKNELAALGLINWQPVHGYLLNQRIKQLGFEQWANLSQSSIYYALGKLTDRGAVTVTTEKDGKSPERTVFHITEAGRAYLVELLRQSLGNVSSDDRLFYLAMSFIDALTVDETIALLRLRIGLMEAIIADETKQAECGAYPPHFALLCQAGARHMEVERDVCRDVIALLQDQPDYFEKLGGFSDEVE